LAVVRGWAAVGRGDGVFGPLFCRCSVLPLFCRIEVFGHHHPMAEYLDPFALASLPSGPKTSHSPVFS
jgi:hypothetical protein